MSDISVPWQHELSVLDRNAKHLAVGRRDNHHLIDQRLERCDIGLGGSDLGQRDVQVLAGKACHRLVVGEARLLLRTLRECQRRIVLIELRLRQIVRQDELPRPIEGFLRKRQVSRRPLDFRLAHRDRLGAEARTNARQFGFGNLQRRLARAFLGDQFRVVDADQRRSARHVL